MNELIYMNPRETHLELGIFFTPSVSTVEQTSIKEP